jgi:hypothetical protein
MKERLNPSVCNMLLWSKLKKDFLVSSSMIDDDKTTSIPVIATKRGAVLLFTNTPLNIMITPQIAVNIIAFIICI